MLILGQKEVNGNLVAVRKRDQGDLGRVEVDKFIANIKEEIEKKEI